MGCDRNLKADGGHRECTKEHNFLLKMFIKDSITGYKLVRHC